MYLIAGLGNHGKEYEKTRHNVGFMVIDQLAKTLHIDALKKKHKAMLAETKIGDHKVILAEPQTFMNLSGEAVAEIAQWYKIPKERIVVISDDVDLETGRIRIRKKGTSGGHKGLDSIIQHLKTTEFTRIRIGVGRGQTETADYVLSNFTKEELPAIGEAIVAAADAAAYLLEHGADAAMNNYNHPAPS